MNSGYDLDMMLSSKLRLNFDIGVPRLLESFLNAGTQVPKSLEV